MNAGSRSNGAACGTARDSVICSATYQDWEIMPQPRRTANGAFHGRLKAGHQEWRWVEQAAAVPMQLSVTQVRPAGWRQHPIQPGLHKNEAVTAHLPIERRA
jgi:hypothetical protein